MYYQYMLPKNPFEKGSPGWVAYEQTLRDVDEFNALHRTKPRTTNPFPPGSAGFLAHEEITKKQPKPHIIRGRKF